MSNVIGFATEFYTLWDKRVEPVYFTDAYGNHWHVRDKEIFSFIKNISKDEAHAKAAYPTAPICMELRGQVRSFERVNKEQDLCPDILKFGKYAGQHIADVAKKDLQYILWIKDNAYNSETRALCCALPEVVEHFENEAAEQANKLASYPVAVDGVNKVTFFGNPNYKFKWSSLCDWDAIPSELTEYEGLHYAAATIGEGNNIFIMFKDIKEVGGIYPYNMAVIQGKPCKTKNKSFTLNLHILRTERLSSGSRQFAIIA